MSEVELPKHEILSDGAGILPRMFLHVYLFSSMRETRYVGWRHPDGYSIISNGPEGSVLNYFTPSHWQALGHVGDAQSIDPDYAPVKSEPQTTDFDLVGMARQYCGAVGLAVRDIPTDGYGSGFRLSLIERRFQDLKEACRSGYIVNIASGIAGTIHDLAYMALYHGIDIAAICNAVHIERMKLGMDGYGYDKSTNLGKINLYSTKMALFCQIGNKCADEMRKAGTDQAKRAAATAKACQAYNLLERATPRESVKAPINDLQVGYDDTVDAVKWVNSNIEVTSGPTPPHKPEDPTDNPYARYSNQGKVNHFRNVIRGAINDLQYALSQEKYFLVEPESTPKKANKSKVDSQVTVFLMRSGYFEACSKAIPGVNHFQALFRHHKGIIYPVSVMINEGTFAHFDPELGGYKVQ